MLVLEKDFHKISLIVEFNDGSIQHFRNIKSWLSINEMFKIYLENGESVILPLSIIKDVIISHLMVYAVDSLKGGEA